MIDHFLVLISLRRHEIRKVWLCALHASARANRNLLTLRV